MNVITYTLLCYGLTIVISFLVIGIVVGINGFMSRSDIKNNQK